MVFLSVENISNVFFFFSIPSLYLSIFDVIYAMIYRKSRCCANENKNKKKIPNVIKNNIWIYDTVPFFNATTNDVFVSHGCEWDAVIRWKRHDTILFFRSFDIREWAAAAENAVLMF